MNEVEVVISGSIINVETKPTRNGTEWFTILVEMGESSYPVKAFGKMAVHFSESGADVGDNIKTTCRLESKEWQGKHFLDLVVENIKVAKAKAVAGGVRKSSFVSAPARGDDEPPVGDYSGGQRGDGINDAFSDDDLPF